MTERLLAARLVLAVVFAVAGAAKLVDEEYRLPGGEDREDLAAGHLDRGLLLTAGHQAKTARPACP